MKPTIKEILNNIKADTIIIRDETCTTFTKLQFLTDEVLNKKVNEFKIDKSDLRTITVFIDEPYYYGRKF